MAKSITDQEILDAALSVFAQEGYVGATTRKISNAAGINEVTLFRRFGNKQNLLRAIIGREAENFVDAGLEYSGDLQADLVKIVTFYYMLVNRRGDVIAMMISEIPRQPELVEIMQGPMSIAHKISLVIARYQAEGVLIDGNPIELVITLVGPILMRELFGSSAPGIISSEFDPQTYVTHFLNGRQVD